MSALRLELRVKNAALWNAIHQQAETVADFCRRFGVPSRQVRVGALLNLQESPYQRHNGELSSIASWLCQVCGIGAGELFPPSLYLKVPPKVFSAEVPAERLLSLSEIKSLPAPDFDEHLERKELSKVVKDALLTLTPRERKIITKRYGFDDNDPLTLEETAKAEGVTRECIRILEFRALRKLRHPSRLRNLLPFTERLSK